MKGRVGLVGEGGPEAGPKDPEANGAYQLSVRADQQLGGTGEEEGQEDPGFGGGGGGAQAEGVSVQGEGERGGGTQRGKERIQNVFDTF